LEATVVGLRITGAVVSGPHDLYLMLDNGTRLLTSSAPDRARVLVTRATPNPDEKSPEWAQRHLVDARIDAIRQPPYERILHFDLVKRDRLGGRAECRLAVEATGRHANVILVTQPKQQVVAALRHVTTRMSRRRQVIPGKPYAPPPPQDNLDPLKVTSRQLASALEPGQDGLAIRLARTVAGLDPLSAREILCLAGVPEADPVGSETCPIEPAGLDRLAEAIRSFMADPPFLAGAQTLTTGRPRAEVCVFAHTCPSFSVLATHPSVSEAIEALDATEATEAVSQGAMSAAVLSADLIDETTRLTKAARKKVARIASDLDEARQAARFEQYGNLLMANLHAVPPGAAEVRVDDLFGNPGEKATIPLRTNRLPRENALDYLKRGKKGRRAEPILVQRLEDTRTRCEVLESSLVRLKQAETEDQVREVESEMRRGKLLGSKRIGGRAAEAASRPSGPRPRRYKTEEGWTVLVGRNNKENDSLTKASAGDDIFLHAHGCPGSHVILKREGRADMPSKDTLREAASLAAYWSKARNAGKVPVVYTEVRHVQKPRGAPPGLVTLRNEKSIMARPAENPRVSEASG
jgi:predicted ribosome quality control (RQC) complex YloA/Tae2 family protein